MTNHAVPAAHLTSGTVILVDGDSIEATVIDVRDGVAIAAVITDAGTLHCSPTTLVTVVR